MEWSVRQKIKWYNDEYLETTYGNDDGTLVRGTKMTNWDP